MHKTKRVSSYRSYSFADKNPTVTTAKTEKISGKEKDDMKNLNTRLANYIDKVNYLEAINKSYRSENEQLKNAPKLTEFDGTDELQGYRELIEKLNTKNAELEIARDNLAYDKKEISEKYEREMQENKDLEKEKKSLISDIDNATTQRANFESKIENQIEDMEVQKQIFDQEKENLRQQIQPMTSFELHTTESAIIPDISETISKVREQYEEFNAQNIEELDNYHKEKIEKLKKQLKTSQEEILDLRSVQNEKITGIRQLQTEIETLHSGNSALNRNIDHLENRLDKESNENEGLLKKLNSELDSAKQDLSHYLKDYMDLNSLKLSLEQEISHYRKLLHGEEIKHSLTKTKYSINRANTSSSSSSSESDT